MRVAQTVIEIDFTLSGYRGGGGGGEATSRLVLY